MKVSQRLAEHSEVAYHEGARTQKHAGKSGENQQPEKQREPAVCQPFHIEDGCQNAKAMGSSCFERTGNVEGFMAGQEHRPGKRATTSTQLAEGCRPHPEYPDLVSTFHTAFPALGRPRIRPPGMEGVGNTNGRLFKRPRLQNPAKMPLCPLYQPGVISLWDDATRNGTAFAVVLVRLQRAISERKQQS